MNLVIAAIDNGRLRHSARLSRLRLDLNPADLNPADVTHQLGP